MCSSVFFLGCCEKKWYQPQNHDGGLTPNVVLGTVQHVGGVDELVARPSDPELGLGVAQDDFTPVGRKHTHPHLGKSTRHGELKVEVLSVGPTWRHRPWG